MDVSEEVPAPFQNIDGFSSGNDASGGFPIKCPVKSRESAPLSGPHAHLGIDPANSGDASQPPAADPAARQAARRSVFIIAGHGR